jgi:hypothetical protein
MRPPKISLLALLLPGVMLIAAACGGPSQTSAVQEVPVAVHIPTSAEVAKQIGCGRYKDLGPGALAGVVTSGTCWRDGKKYGIDTFASLSVRDEWLKTAERFGVSPEWKTSTSVVYPSVSGK